MTPEEALQPFKQLSSGAHPDFPKLARLLFVSSLFQGGEHVRCSVHAAQHLQRGCEENTFTKPCIFKALAGDSRMKSWP